MTLILVKFALGASCFLVVACGGGSDNDGNGPDSAPSAQSTPGGGQATTGEINPCSLLTRSEAEAVLGGPTSEPERPREAPITCRYTAQKGQAVSVLVVLVLRHSAPAEAKAGYESATRQFPGAQAVAGVGDAATYAADLEQLHVHKGNVYMIVSGDVDLENAKSLAQKALGRLN